MCSPPLFPRDQGIFSLSRPSDVRRFAVKHIITFAPYMARSTSAPQIHCVQYCILSLPVHARSMSFPGWNGDPT